MTLPIFQKLIADDTSKRTHDGKREKAQGAEGKTWRF